VQLVKNFRYSCNLFQYFDRSFICLPYFCYFLRCRPNFKWW